MKETKTYLIEVKKCPHCKSKLEYSSESASLEKTMQSIFSLLGIHKSNCNKIKGKKWTSVYIRERKNSKGTIISEYKTNKILF
jgi:uncharacterized protein YbaR (Trm112 family)